MNTRSCRTRPILSEMARRPRESSTRCWNERTRNGTNPVSALPGFSPYAVVSCPARSFIVAGPAQSPRVESDKAADLRQQAKDRVEQWHEDQGSFNHDVYVDEVL